MTVYLELDYRHALYVDNDEPDRYVKHIPGHILEITEDDGRIEVGAFSIFIVDVEAAVIDEQSVFDVFDTRHATFGYHKLLNGELEFKKSVLDAMGGEDRWSPNMLILDRLTSCRSIGARASGFESCVGCGSSSVWAAA